MKNVIYTKKELGSHRGRVLSVRETCADKDGTSYIRKGFVYLVSPVDAVPSKIPSPEIRVVKAIEQAKAIEKFMFSVKGTVYFKKNRIPFRVDYKHSLKINAVWKTHVLSSDPAALA